MPRIDDAGAPLRSWSEPIFRVMLSLIFCVAGLNHLLSSDKVAARLESAPFQHLVTGWASPTLLVVLAGVALLGGGLSLMLGFRTRSAALLLILVLVPITLTVQLTPESLGPLFKNVALLGGLIHFVAQGSHCWCVDAWLSRGRRRMASVAATAAS